MPDPSPSNADSLKLQLLTARKKECWPATADSLPQAVYLTTVKHTALAGIEPTITDWSNDWQMTFNVDKCKVMHVGRTNLHSKYYMN